MSKTLERYLEKNDVKTIVIHFDRDGPGVVAANALMEVLKENYEVINEPPLMWKDFNDYLQIVGGNISVR